MSALREINLHQNKLLLEALNKSQKCLSTQVIEWIWSQQTNGGDLNFVGL